MQHQEGTLEGAAGHSVYYQYWLPGQEARAVILLAHGAGEHSGRYAAVAEQFCANAYAVAALDHIGHGRSDGDYGHMASFDDHLETLERFRQQVAARFPGLPMILIGHSMGGLISSCFLLRHQQQFAGCALSGPAIKSDLEPGFLQLALIRLLSRIAPRLGVLQLDATGVSRDPAVVKAYVEDPLVNHGKMSAGFVAGLFTAMNEIQQRAGEISLPLLIMHGEQDSMASPAGAEFLFDAVSSADKQLKLYPHLYHEILNEPEREQVMADLLAWCEQRL
ncbi:alpha/beta fold hydrolase [Seongchinamella sediminis]|uniref:Monoacylglycerol lipase n=1 Tax=Seongchinamella sediminis TaxID=2283635 RepID=A0A3L7E209_9GAMM|nr:alpha/beta hydrolase [Seongchinamella sediminis]RLQ22182.1 alpha/beta fold hydrolase [Seongchinamella sediminis]